MILSTLIEVKIASETSVLTRAAGRDIPKDDILHSHRRKNLNYYVPLFGWAIYRRYNVFPLRYEQRFYIQETAFFIATAVKTSNLT
jgi:hypothetical protein